MRSIKMITLLFITMMTTSSFAEPVKSGMFTVYNDTGHTIKIGVGNYFPTSYTVPSHGSTLVYVSTDNQNIHIDSVS